MPSKSPAQAKLMRAVAHGWKKPGGGGPSQSVAKEFVNADRRSKVQGYQFGGMAMPAMRGMMQKPQFRGALDPRSMPPQGGGGQPWRGAPPPRAMRGDPRSMPPQPYGGRGGFGGRGDPRSMPPQGGGGQGGIRAMMQRMQQQRQGQQGGGGRGGALRQMMQQMQQRQKPTRQPFQHQGGGGQPFGGRDPRAMPPQGRSGMRRPMQNLPPPNKGPRRMVPPSPPRGGGYPGGGNPMTGGRNPMMRQRGRYMGGSPTRMMR